MAAKGSRVLLLASVLCFQSSALATADGVPADWVIRLQVRGLPTRAPSFDVSIRSDGLVTYQGGTGAKLTGKRQGTEHEKGVRRSDSRHTIGRPADTVGINGIPLHYREWILELRLEGRTKRVVGNQINSEGLAPIVDKIEKITGIRDWTGRATVQCEPAETCR